MRIEGTQAKRRRVKGSKMMRRGRGKDGAESEEKGRRRKDRDKGQQRMRIIHANEQYFFILQ